MALIRDARIAWTGHFGVRDRTTGVPVDDGTVFSAQSMSKPIFAYRVMKLCEQGVLDLDAPLTRYTPDVFVKNDPRLHDITARRVDALAGKELLHHVGDHELRQGPGRLGVGRILDDHGGRGDGEGAVGREHGLHLVPGLAISLCEHFVGRGPHGRPTERKLLLPGDARLGTAQDDLLLQEGIERLAQPLFGLRLDERDSALKGGDSGSAAIVPGKPDESELIRRVS